MIMELSKTPTIAEQYHAGLNSLYEQIVSTLIEVIRYSGVQVVVSKAGNPQVVIPKASINTALLPFGVHVTNDMFVQGTKESLTALGKQ
jgi:hypothetical protein|tara:strand:+ start:362 stop:628 length:267 start_codon:yes stop_codon:yes gene_type:complete